jgi:hypothetical protein
MNVASSSCCVVTLIVGALTVARAEDSQSWSFNAPRGEGYAVDLEAADPKPGTPLLRGATVAFKVSVKYALEVAKRGDVILVFQDSQEQSLTADREQVTAEVSGGQGTLTLTDSIVVPANASELHLFIPLVPDGMKTTTGEITIRYPITTTAVGPQYMPHPMAEISEQEWKDYHQSVQEACGSTRRAFADEHLEVFECPANSLHLAFTTEGHPAHPAWITRQVQAGTVEQIGYFAGQEEPFAVLFQSYLDLTNRTLKSVSDDKQE